MTSGHRHRSLDPVALRADAPRDPTPCARRCSSTVRPIIDAPFATAPTSTTARVPCYRPAAAVSPLPKAPPSALSLAHRAAVQGYKTHSSPLQAASFNPASMRSCTAPLHDQSRATSQNPPDSRIGVCLIQGGEEVRQRMDLRPRGSGTGGIYECASRTEAAKTGGVTLQIVRDWVMKFNAHGPEALIDCKPPGQPSRLNGAHRAALAAILESGPIPAVHGVVRWRIVDPLPMDLRGIPRRRRQADIEPGIARYGIS
jgi:hypothetical protein